jgi:undecaprenyl-diphosphatase
MAERVAGCHQCESAQEGHQVRRKSRLGTTQDDGWTSEVSSGFALAAFLTLVFVGFTLLALGPLISIDAYFNLKPPPPAWVPVLHVLDRMGQRAVCLPILGLVTFLACRRQESWRPGVVTAISVFMLNLIMLFLKLGFGRGEPNTSDPSFFNGGMAYPSGHSSNIVLVYGLTVYLLARYFSLRRSTLTLLWSIVGVLSVTMVITSLTLDWHWFADLIAGLIVGGIVLQLTATINRAIPAVSFEHGWRAGLHDLGLTVQGKGRRPSAPEAPAPAEPEPGLTRTDRA